MRQEIADVEVFLSATLAKAAPASQSQTATEVRAPPAVSRPTPPGPSFVALVFDRLSPEARALAYRGALAHLETMSADDYVGVFIADLSLISVQTYTNDRLKLRQAITPWGRLRLRTSTEPL